MESIKMRKDGTSTLENTKHTYSVFFSRICTTQPYRWKKIFSYEIIAVEKDATTTTTTAEIKSSSNWNKRYWNKHTNKFCGDGMNKVSNVFSTLYSNSLFIRTYQCTAFGERNSHFTLFVAVECFIHELNNSLSYTTRSVCRFLLSKSLVTYMAKHLLHKYVSHYKKLTVGITK